MQAFRSYSTIDQQEQQERLTAPTNRLITLNVSYVLARVGRCKAFKYKCKE